MFKQESEHSSDDENLEEKEPSKMILMPMKDEIHRIIMSSVFQVKKQPSMKKASK